MSTGENIRQLRREAGYTQKELGEFIGVKAPYISALERGLRKPGQKLLPLLCDALGVDETMILYGTLPMRHHTLWNAIANLTDQQAAIVLRFIKLLKAPGNGVDNFFKDLRDWWERKDLYVI